MKKKEMGCYDNKALIVASLTENLLLCTDADDVIEFFRNANKINCLKVVKKPYKRIMSYIRVLGQVSHLAILS